MSPKWLTVLVRARKAQEDVAQQHLARAEHAVRRTQARVRYDEERLDLLSAADADLHAASFIASAVALQAAAATLAATVDAARDASHHASQRRSSLHHAARARHTAEELNDRAAVLDRIAEAAAIQREHDEVAARVHRLTPRKRTS